MPFPTLRVSTLQSSVSHHLLSVPYTHASSAQIRMHPRNTAISTDSEYSHYAWAQQPRTEGGLGPNLRIPLLADPKMRVAREYGCLIEDKGITFRASYCT